MYSLPLTVLTHFSTFSFFSLTVTSDKRPDWCESTGFDGQPWSGCCLLWPPLLAANYSHLWPLSCMIALVLHGHHLHHCPNFPKRHKRVKVLALPNYPQRWLCALWYEMQIASTFWRCDISFYFKKSSPATLAFQSCTVCFHHWLHRLL